MGLLDNIKKNIDIVKESKFMWYFDLREFCITDNPVPLHTADKIIKYHMLPMNLVREVFGKPVIVSKRSGYRPINYELSMGRTGASQHCFIGKGAADYTHSGNWDLFIKLLRKYTDYTRICYYPNNNFVHCDYASDKRLFYTASSPAGSWGLVGDLGDFKTVG
jgi:hypothetical protein